MDLPEQDSMSSEDNGETIDDVLDSYEQPQTEVKWLPEWDDHPEERPGENTRLEDGVLRWEKDGFDVRLESYETTHWKATVSIPEWVGEYFPRSFDLKCTPLPEYGFVKSVAIEDYAATEATLIIQSNYQPTWEVNNWIEARVLDAEEQQEFMDEVSERISDANERVAESRMKESGLERVPLPGADDGETYTCPFCGFKDEYVMERDDGGHNCPNCSEPIDAHLDANGYVDVD